tara:strand:- start:231 stop:386 length:156 start_codon:yes stop_codon:yes gene_type:complete
MGELEVSGEPPIDELLNDPIMQMLLNTGDMTLDRLRPMLDEMTARIYPEVA